MAAISLILKIVTLQFDKVLHISQGNYGENIMSIPVFVDI